MKLVAFHLLNDYSGSPLVLTTVLRQILQRGVEVELVSTEGGPLDSLSEFPGFKHRSYTYQFSPSGWRTMMLYAAVQLRTFFSSWRYLFSRDTVFYINTLLPVGPALAGRMMGKRVIYHYHENARVKGVVYRVLSRAMQILAHDIICVSSYQSAGLRRKRNVKVVPNSLPDAFKEQLTYAPEDAFARKSVLMLSSLKGYKGTAEFIELSRRIPEYSFTLVINDTVEAINRWFSENGIFLPDNLIIHPRQKDVARFYNEASVVLNLSDKQQFVETFGLTAIEAMAGGKPVVVPTEGGIAEIVEDGVTGYHCDVTDLDGVEADVRKLLSDKKLYQTMAENALKVSAKYTEKTQGDAIMNILNA